MGVAVAFLWGIFWAESPVAAIVQHPPAYGFDDCRRCHEDRLDQHLTAWQRSVHARAGLGCASCHAIAPMRLLGQLSSRRDPDSITFLCGSCHKAVAEAFVQSRHQTESKKKADGVVPSCADCHTTAGGNNLPAELFGTSCGRCHDGQTNQADPVSAQAVSFLNLLRQIAIARTVVLEQIAAKKAAGARTDEVEGAMRKAVGPMQDLAQAWHRFDFAKAGTKGREVLSGLEVLHQNLKKPNE